MAGEEELRARAVLAEMLMRISQGPYAALSVFETASAEQVRASFLDLTKQFHPARFARMSTELQRMANEVFLGIKGAHDHLTKQLGSTGRAPTRSSTAPATTPATRGDTVRGTGLAPRSQSPQPTARGSDRPSTRPSAPLLTPADGIPRPTTPVGARATSPVQSTQPLPRTPTPAIGIPIQRPGTPPADTGERRPTPPTGIPAQRPTPLGTPAFRPQTPGQPRSTSPLPTTRPTTPSRTPDAINPPTIRYSGVQPSASSSGSIPRQGKPSEEQELQSAMDLVSAQDFAGARAAFHSLAARVPQNRRYRALLCYARGRETLSLGRKDDAVLEFQRALQLDPQLEIATEAIREAQRKSRW